MARPDASPWAGRSVTARANPRDTWHFARDGRSVLLNSGDHQATLNLRETKWGWQATSQPLRFVFRRDGMWMQFWLDRTHVETLRMVDTTAACS